MVISIGLVTFPAYEIIERYVYRTQDTPQKYWLANLQRTVIFGLAVTGCIFIRNTLNKFSSAVGTVTAAPFAFIIPCLAHYNLCNPSPLQKLADGLGIGFALRTRND